jgi:Tripartite tricarboxylate transporter family receptor
VRCLTSAPAVPVIRSKGLAQSDRAITVPQPIADRDAATTKRGSYDHEETFRVARMYGQPRFRVARNATSGTISNCPQDRTDAGGVYARQFDRCPRETARERDEELFFFLHRRESSRRRWPHRAGHPERQRRQWLRHGAHASIGPKVPGDVKTLADFIAWCRANPKDASYATAAAGSMLHFFGVMLGRAAGFEFMHVPYPGAGGVQDLLAGQIAASVYPIGTTLAHVQAGSLRALVTTGPRRTILLPNVPTVSEAGYSALETTEWFGVLAPAKTPAEIVNNLNSAIREVLKAEAFKAGVAKLSYETAGVSPSDFAKLIKSDFDRWGPIVRASGFTPDE